jgi:hypothetical protein
VRLVASCANLFFSKKEAYFLVLIGELFTFAASYNLSIHNKYDFNMKARIFLLIFAVVLSLAVARNHRMRKKSKKVQSRVGENLPIQMFPMKKWNGMILTMMAIRLMKTPMSQMETIRILVDTNLEMN